MTGGKDAREWQKAAKSEYDQLVSRQTWDPKPVDLPPGQKALGSKWVFKTKLKEDGSVERHKGRLVIKGYGQVPKIAFWETFAPVVRASTVRFVATYVARYGL